MDQAKTTDQRATRTASGAGPALLLPQDVAEQLGVSRKALERWRCTGEGPRFVRLGHKTVRYRPEDIEAFIGAKVMISTAAG
jgi:predicted DNA-binding transcriptional regulator AlpA